MKLSQHEEVNKLIKERAQLIKAREQAESWDGSTEHWCSLSQYPDGSGFRINMANCGVMSAMVEAAHLALTARLGHVNRQLTGLGVHIDV